MTATALAAPSSSRSLRHSRALVLVQTAEEREYHRLQIDLALRQAQIAGLEAEVAPLVAALESFEWSYKARIGVLQAELRGLRDTIDRLRSRVARIHARMAADPNGILGDLFSREELLEIGDMFDIEIPPSWFAAAEAERNAERDRAWRYFGADRDGFDDNEPPTRRLARRHALSDAVKRELREIYLALARRFHPDLAKTEADRTRCQEIMLRVNAAWHDSDLDAMRHIDGETADELPASGRIPWGKRVAWARTECQRLDREIVRLRTQLRSLRASDTFPLWFNQTLGNSVISQRVAALRIDIATAAREVDLAKGAFRQALRSYAVGIGD